ncbi:grasp-with-spasm system SPASM domain peptide maturase [Mucilaginibacter sp. CSA2-8R]|uniref:grasp-with-spasm system SPASM domain peptide maturase n=1 Tax=Mucilaginibacter sp. CSA2-8R TaxID=3141542 RepID=UPI00315D5EFB
MSKMVLCANCFPVKGYTRSIICDVIRYKYDFIPNSMYIFLKNYNRTDLEVLKATLSPDQRVIVESYIDFLLDRDYIFFTDNPEYFPEVEIAWDESSVVTNAIVDFDEHSQHSLNKIVSELNHLRCNALEIRTFFPKNAAEIEAITQSLSESSLRSVQFILAYHEEYTRSYFQNLMKKNQRLMSVVIHSTPDPELFKENPENYNIFFITNPIESEAHCGAISNFNFASNISLFMESQFYNNCLNRKISIDKRGFIKNCPSMQNDFGHHFDVTLSMALDVPEFKELWSVKKDDINICKDCEFRYICTDCRAYTQYNSSHLGKPLKCNYDPYAAVWETEKSPFSTAMASPADTAISI